MRLVKPQITYLSMAAMLAASAPQAAEPCKVRSVCTTIQTVPDYEHNHEEAPANEPDVFYLAAITHDVEVYWANAATLEGAPYIRSFLHKL
jgi:hypothetical protein